MRTTPTVLDGLVLLTATADDLVVADGTARLDDHGGRGNKH